MEESFTSTWTRTLLRYTSPDLWPQHTFSCRCFMVSHHLPQQRDRLTNQSSDWSALTDYWLWCIWACSLRDSSADDWWHLTSACFQGNVYVKCPSIPAAMAAVNSLHGRYFAGKTSCHMTLLWTNKRAALMSHLFFQVRWSLQRTSLCPPTTTCFQSLLSPHSCWPHPHDGDSQRSTALWLDTGV